MAKPEDPPPPGDQMAAENIGTVPAEGYRIGYGKPPLHSRFRPGQSGNPKGRPRHSRNLKNVVSDAMRQPVVIVENGRRRTVPARDAIVKREVQQALQGDQKSIAKVLELDIRFMDEEAGPMQLPVDPEKDAEIVQDFLSKRSGDANA